jgi:hypothetical protein
MSIELDNSLISVLQDAINLNNNIIWCFTEGLNFVKKSINFTFRLIFFQIITNIAGTFIIPNQ